MSDDGGVESDVGSEIEPESEPKRLSGDSDDTSDSELDSSDETNGGTTRDESGATGSSMSIIDARKHAMSVAGELLGTEPESVIRAERTDRGWRVLVEVVERSAVPDTQDILGRYELIIQSDAVIEYGLTERYKRGDSRDEL